MKKLIFLILFFLSYGAVAEIIEIPIQPEAIAIDYQGVTLTGVTDDPCSLTYDPALATDNATHIGKDNEYTGTLYTPASSECVCAVEIEANGENGTPANVDAFNYYSKIFTRCTGVDAPVAGCTEDDLAALVGAKSSVVAGTADWTAGNWIRFDFETCVDLTGSADYFITIYRDDNGDDSEPDTDGTDYVFWQYQADTAAGVESSGKYIWNWDDTIPYADSVMDTDDNMGIKVWTE